jgi:hypothetical protein
VDAQYIQLGVLNPLEVREARFGGTEYSIETTLNEAVTEQLITTTDAGFQAQMLDFQAQQEAALNPQPEQAALPPGQDAEAPEDEPRPVKTDKFDSYGVQGLRIRVSHEANGLKAGYLVDPNGQRTDASADAPLMIFGPHRTRAYKIYRARLAPEPGQRSDAYLTGFASQRSARYALATFFPRQTVTELSPVPEGEVQALRAGSEAS